MEHKIVISGEGSAHPKLGVKKKNSVEENLKILNEMIESGKLSLDHAIAKTRPGGTLRGIFKCSEDDEMLSHVEALYDFVVAYKKRLVPDYDPSAPVKKVQKDVDPEKLARRPHDFTSRSPRRRLCDDVSLTQAQGPRDRRHHKSTRRARRQPVWKSTSVSGTLH